MTNRLQIRIYSAQQTFLKEVHEIEDDALERVALELATDHVSRLAGRRDVPKQVMIEIEWLDSPESNRIFRFEVGQ